MILMLMIMIRMEKGTVYVHTIVLDTLSSIACNFAKYSLSLETLQSFDSRELVKCLPGFNCAHHESSIRINLTSPGLLYQVFMFEYRCFGDGAV